MGKLPPLSEVNYDQTRVFTLPASAIAEDGTLVLALRVWGGSELAVASWGGGYWYLRFDGQPVALSPGLDIHYPTLHPWQLWSVPLLLAIPWIIMRETATGNREARTALAGVFIFAAACVNDLLIDLAGWQTTRLVPVGFVAIIASMANRFTYVLNDLEGEVAQRTADLIAATANWPKSPGVIHSRVC